MPDLVLVLVKAVPTSVDGISGSSKMHVSSGFEWYTYCQVDLTIAVEITGCHHGAETIASR